jgi:tetratricopeptide (TPR) repeat protein
MDDPSFKIAAGQPETLPSALQFISAGVLQRLAEGSFVPNRRSKPGNMTLSDRRDTISPLAVTKRCVRYEPRVFENRKSDILRMAEHLNHPDRKIILLSGDQGSGKTSLARGLIELMGGGNEQLLWFDVTRHTDFTDITDFLIQYVTYIGAALSRTPQLTGTKLGKGGQPSDAQRLEQLETLLSDVEDVPLLIVIDNVEHIVDAEFRIHSPPLKETLNFLLSFPNIKMMLLGERLPYADLSFSTGAMNEIKLAGLRQDDVSALLGRELPEDLPADEANRLLFSLYQATSGSPWLTRVLGFVTHHHPQQLIRLDDLMRARGAGLSGPQAVAEGISRFLYDRLAPDQQAVMQILAFLRHPVDLGSLAAMTRFCMPHVSLDTLDSLEKSFIKPVLRKTFPPQIVLEHIRDRLHGRKPFEPWYELYRPVRKVIYTSLPEDERARIHNLLQEFYRKEHEKPFASRQYRVRSQALLTEERHHRNAARKRRIMVSPTADAGTEALSLPAPLETRSYVSRALSHSQPLSTAANAGLPIPVGIPQSTLLAGGAFPVISLPGEPGLQLTPEEVMLLQGSGTPVIPSSLAGAPVGGPRVDLPWGGALPSEPALPATFPQAFEGTPTLGKFAQAVQWREHSTDPEEKRIQQHLAAAVLAHDQPKLLASLVDLARHRISVGFYQEAEACLLKAMEYDLTATPERQSEVYCLLGAICKETYRHNLAINHLQKALLALRERPAAHEAFGTIHTHLGEIAAFRHQPTDAIRQFEGALRHYAEAGLTSQEADLHFRLAEVQDATGDKASALAHYEAALRLDKSQGNDSACAATLANLGSLHLEAARPLEALRCFSESLGYDRRVGNREGEFKTLGLIGATYLAMRQPERTETVFRQALAVALEENVALWKATMYLKLGDLARHVRQERDIALQHYRAALDAGGEELSAESKILLHARIEDLQRGSADDPATP